MRICLFYNTFYSIIIIEYRLLIPGGGASLLTSGYSKAGSILYELAIEANNNGDFFLVWGTCWGFELLLYLSATKRNYLSSCESYNRASQLKFLSGAIFIQAGTIGKGLNYASNMWLLLSDASTSVLFKRAPMAVMKTLSKEKSTSNFHHWCMTMENMTTSSLDKFYRSLATTNDDKNLEFVASIEAVNYPIWGVQFHPEKNV